MSNTHVPWYFLFEKNKKTSKFADEHTYWSFSSSTYVYHTWHLSYLINDCTLEQGAIDTRTCMSSLFTDSSSKRNRRSSHFRFSSSNCTSNAFFSPRSLVTVLSASLIVCCASSRYWTSTIKLMKHKNQNREGSRNEDERRRHVMELSRFTRRVRKRVISRYPKS